MLPNQVPVTDTGSLTWLGGMCFPLRRSSNIVPKLYITLSGVTRPVEINTARYKNRKVATIQIKHSCFPETVAVSWKIID